ncbi:hypothetical protein N656DRAFT_605554 [Canariomyces notabilis]|uniref:Uncharacterized protein n=1 Tax=Canariomyces notabilis TaxID=2074819 RepID=A0AAN6YUF1_9PEZI|nr:hypothetical protein N656DRAFT_605554 [Canariomyces arenarius]
MIFQFSRALQALAGASTLLSIVSANLIPFKTFYRNSVVYWVMTHHVIPDLFLQRRSSFKHTFHKTRRGLVKTREQTSKPGTCNADYTVHL